MSPNFPVPNFPSDSQILQSALQEIEELGFRFSDVPLPDSTPYAIIGGRSNARWWLIPLTNRRVASSGLALFQPVITSARLLKMAATSACSIGFTGLLARNKVFITRESYLSNIFDNKDLCYAFFTGTNSPHRKVAVQIMVENGSIIGFAKVSCNQAVKPLLAYEAKTLNHLHSLNLQTALIPRVLFCGNIAGADVLVTDTRKTSRTKTEIKFNRSHIAFLRELGEKTALPGVDSKERFVKGLHNRYAVVVGQMPREWQGRLYKAITIVARHEKKWGQRSLSHGDFTPWNTFFVDGALYVFDWEYAERECSPGYDLIHFLLSLPATKKKPFHYSICQIRKLLREMTFAENDVEADILILSYLCRNTLRYIARELEENNKKVFTWDGERKAADFLETIIERFKDEYTEIYNY